MFRQSNASPFSADESSVVSVIQRHVMSTGAGPRWPSLHHGWPTLVRDLKRRDLVLHLDTTYQKQTYQKGSLCLVWWRGAWPGVATTEKCTGSGHGFCCTLFVDPAQDRPASTVQDEILLSRDLLLDIVLERPDDAGNSAGFCLPRLSFSLKCLQRSS